MSRRAVYSPKYRSYLTGLALPPGLRMPANRGIFCAFSLATLAGYVVWFSAFAPDRSVWLMLAIFIAALVSSVAGFAFSAICGAMLFHLHGDAVVVVQIMMICSVGGQALMIWSLRHDIAWRDLGNFLVGAAVGLPIGVFILLHMQPAIYVHAIGVLLVLYAAYMIARSPLVIRRQHPALDAAVGFLGGITGGAAAFPGAFVTIWCGLKGWTKERQRGLYQPFILIVQLAAITLMVLVSLDHRGAKPFDYSGIAYVPATIVGSVLGLAVFKRLNDRQFALAVNLFLIVSGLSLVV
jgi:uncharacterized protein